MLKSEENITPVKPFLKWAGGKTQLLGAIENKIVPFLQARKPVVYLEPFIGSGAVLFFLLRNYRHYIKRAIICDINLDLINLYRVIRDEPQALIADLADLEKSYFGFSTEDERKLLFLALRSEFNQLPPSPVRKSALLLFLNKTCFNGLYRVNAKGGFNVPFGRYKNPTILNRAVILADSAALQHTEILHGDFTQTEAYVEKNSLVYLDPPYKPLSPTASFNTYAREGFYDEDQLRLKQFCDRVEAAGGYFILSNSDTATSPGENSFFDTLYQDYSIERVKARRAINSKGTARGEISELLITNDAVWRLLAPGKELSLPEPGH
jgi:DNA adenine methylase